jgi:hypothetical protein
MLKAINKENYSILKICAQMAASLLAQSNNTFSPEMIEQYLQGPGSQINVPV